MSKPKTDPNPNGGPRRTKLERERDLAILSELYVKGMTEWDMTQAISSQYPFDLSIRTIKNDKNELRKRWIESQLVNFDEAKARELELIDKLIEACWVGWERSLNPEGHETIEESLEDKLPGGEGTNPIALKSVRKINKRADRDGNVIWIEEMRKLSDQRARIFGLYEPDKFQIDWRSRLEESGMSSSDIEATLQEAMQVVDKVWGNMDGE